MRIRFALVDLSLFFASTALAVGAAYKVYVFICQVAAYPAA
jgi:hypothetical protein